MMKDRLREARKSLGLSQQEFGAKIGISNTAISKLEKGENNMTEQLIKAVCREFHISYDWLKSGSGEMMQNLSAGLVDELAQEYGLDELDRRIILAYVSAEAGDRAAMKTILKNIFQA